MNIVSTYADAVGVSLLQVCALFCTHYEMEKRMLYQTEGCERYAVINELSMALQYADDPARRKAAKDLMEKLRMFLTDASYQKFLDSQERGEVKARLQSCRVQ